MISFFMFHLSSLNKRESPPSSTVTWKKSHRGNSFFLKIYIEPLYGS